MKNFCYKTLYFFAYGFWYILSLLPFCILYAISDFLCFIAEHIIKYRYAVVYDNLRTSFPEKNDREIKKIAHGFYHWFCDYIVETVKLMTMSPAQLKKRMKIIGAEKLCKYFEEGHSVAIYLGHYCNWEWLTSMPYWVPDNVVNCQIYHPLYNEYFDKLFKFVRERQGALCIPMKESLRKIMEYRKNNNPIAIGYIADQSPKWENIHHWVQFMNHETPVFTGSERIVKRTDQIPFYGDYRRVKRGYYECEVKLMFEHPEEVPDYGVTDLYFQLLEKTIRRQPECYLWSHKRWKRTRAEFNLRYYVDEKGRVMRREGA